MDSLFEMTSQQILGAMLGFFGNIPISGTNPVRGKFFSFEADEDSVIASVKDKDGKERISDIGWSTKTVKATKTCYFGFEATEVSLTSGSGTLNRSQIPF